MKNIYLTFQPYIYAYVGIKLVLFLVVTLIN
jgi:hypothetical protein